MEAMQNVPPVNQIRPIRKPPVLFYLLAGGTGLLLAWLSVGLTPSTWGLLFQVISQFKFLWAQHGITALWTLLLLMGQSLLLLVAWMLLIGIVVRESTHLHASQPASPMPVYAPPMPAYATPVPPQPAYGAYAGAATAFAPPPAPGVEATVLAPPPPPPGWQAPAYAQPNLGAAMPPPATGTRPSEYAQADFVSGQAFIDQLKAYGAPPMTTQSQIDAQPTVVSPIDKTPPPPSAQPAQADQNAYIAEMLTRINDPEEEMPTLITPLSEPDLPVAPVQKTPDPYAAPSVFASEEQAPISDLQQRAQRAEQVNEGEKTLHKRPTWQSDDLSSDPFALHEDILGLSLQENPLPSASNRPTQTPHTPPAQPAQPAQSEHTPQQASNRPEQTPHTPSAAPAQPAQKTPLANEEDDVFVFGNPFEGALPDVFEHDEDLKRSLKEQTSGSHPALEDTGKSPSVKKQT